MSVRGPGESTRRAVPTGDAPAAPTAPTQATGAAASQSAATSSTASTAAIPQTDGYGGAAAPPQGSATSDGVARPRTDRAHMRTRRQLGSSADGAPSRPAAPPGDLARAVLSAEFGASTRPSTTQATTGPAQTSPGVGQSGARPSTTTASTPATSAPVAAALPSIVAKQTAPPPPAIPDAHATAANTALRFVDLNRQINAGYAQFANQFQSIVDPGFAASGTSSTNPVWFGFAPYASRGVGRGELAVETALSAIQTYDGTSMSNLLQRAGVPESVARIAGPVIDNMPTLPGMPNSRDMRIAAAFTVAVASGMQNPGALDAGNLGALLDPRTLAITAGRMASLAASAPGATITDKLRSVGNTLRNALEDGNRRIYGDVGGAAQDYLQFRNAQGSRPTPDQVLNNFSLSQPPNPAQARQIYDFAQSQLNASPQPTDFDRRFPAPPMDTKNMMVAAFALYEKAGTTTNAAEKNKLIAFANNLMAYREQHDAVQPAFTPGRVLPGEVDRRELFRAMTPTVSLPLRSGSWNFDDYASDHLPARDHNPFTPRVTEYNWGEFGDRWTPILNAFQQGYNNPRAMWPMPNADPNQGF